MNTQRADDDPERTPDLVTPGQRLGELFRSRLNELFAAAERRGERLTNREVVRWMSDHGYPIKDAYFSQLRSGRATSPSLKVIEGISAYFGVESSTFLDVDRRRAELDDLLEEHGVRSVATRAVGLSDENIDAIARLLDRFREVENLPPIRPEGAGDGSRGK
ncbi:hypothetical protein [Myceligenerans indicum]|uniref:Transcriptional regulator n=1 Tax=Myceligenerans indicum TaxID=2593663 RepID=A0ABS1LKI4_9MICO|nr:hypothetical protein [Myceligenerans indicum]MBL0886726.1 hypothetical protein [Myceligenerans indicum]